MNGARRGIALALCTIIVSLGCAINARALPIEGSIASAPSEVQVRYAAPTPLARANMPFMLRLPLLTHAGIPSTFGVEGTLWSAIDPNQVAQAVRQTGVAWTRTNVLRWAQIQAQPGGAYNWTESDRVLASIAAKGLRPIVIIWDNPTWASVDPVNLPSGPIKTEYVPEFARFVQTAVSRYSRPPYNVMHYELYNEPDGSGYIKIYGGGIGMWGQYGAAYAGMLKAVYPTVKAANPAAQVVFGGLAYSGFRPNGFQQQFLDDVLAAGGGAYFDIFNFHYYKPQASEWGAYGTDILGKVNYLKSKLGAHGITNKPMMVTEIGTFGDPDDGATLVAQAEYVPKVNIRGMSAGLVNAIWYDVYDGTLVSGTNNGTGLSHAGVPKPAHHAYQTMATVMANQRFRRTIPLADVSPNPATEGAYFEGYAFESLDGREDLWVVWLNQGSATIAVRANTVEVVDMLNNRTTLHAGSDGLVRLRLTTSPLYLRF